MNRKTQKKRNWQREPAGLPCSLDGPWEVPYNGTVFSVGSLQLSAPLVLAPMAGVTDLPFRLIARRFGCRLAYTEMISARALVFQNWRTLGLLRSGPEDRPLGIQLLGRDPESLVKAVEALADYPYDVLDLNAACPVHKVTRKGEGAALLREPRTLSMLVRALVSRARVPVTVKIRSGWDAASVNALEIAKSVEDAGAAAVCVHGRTRSQGYGGRADPSVAMSVKEALRIPVIVSGDILSGEAALKTLEETGCDAVMIARGALGNPWIFRDLTAIYGNGPAGTASAHDGREGQAVLAAARTLEEVKETMGNHLALSVAHHGPEKAVVGFRKCFIWYTRGLRNARSLRPKAVRVSDIDEMKALIDGL